MAGNISDHWTVHQTLKTYPQAVPVFIRLKTDCVGCWLERFCTLADVSNNYGLQLDDLLASLCSVGTPGAVEEER
jgi:hybrid cluster-associated redox disulfide protein